MGRQLATVVLVLSVPVRAAVGPRPIAPPPQPVAFGAPPPAFEGKFVSGTGDPVFVALLDKAARQHDPAGDATLQTVLQLYRGDWDGFTEGFGWAAWWTQNSYGPTFSAAPYMGDVEYAATLHANAWWFNSIGDNKTAGYTNEGPAPDGCLCDAATPCATNECCYYKQGDGDVPRHDWTMEESLSAVLVQAELLLVSRNRTGAAYYLPLFERTAQMLERRRDPVDTSVFLTGPSTNLLAPSFGGGPNGSRAYLAGVSVTYAAALAKMSELATLVGNTSFAAECNRRRELNLAGIAKHFIAIAPNGGRYLVRSKDPGTQLRHGVLGQQIHGYYEASPNHDAVVHRVVDDGLAEEFMGVIDWLGSRIRPNTFILPNTDAGGGVGYDDMLCGSGATCGGIFAFGQWVNGGVWSTQEARAILAYYRTDRVEQAAASFDRMLTNFGNSWQMDAPLTNFGQSTWFHKPTLLTIDAFGVGSALLRGLFEYVYTAESLVLIPKVPDNVSALSQHFGVRWGAYRLFISTRGVRSSGIARVTVGGIALPQIAFNGTTIVLPYSAMPPPSVAAAVATDSDISIAFDAVDLVITFTRAGSEHSRDSKSAHMTNAPHSDSSQRHTSAAPLAGADIVLRAADLGILPIASRVTSWPTSRESGSTANFTVVAGGVTPTMAVDSNGRRAVHFDGKTTALGAALDLSANTTTIAVFLEEGSPVMYSSVVHFDNFRGLAISPTNCAQGSPPGPHNCSPANARVVAIDWSGSTDGGLRNVTGRVTVASVRYGARTASSTVGTCSEHVAGDGVVSTPSTPPSSIIGIGSRCDGYGRFFKGLVYEVQIFNRTLSDEDLDAAISELEQAYGVGSTNCSALPTPNLNCTALKGLCVSSTWPRLCGLNVTESDRLSAFVGRLSTPTLNRTLPAAMARAALDYDAAFSARCSGLVGGSIEPLLIPSANIDSLADLLATSGNLYSGLSNVLATRYANSADPLAKAVVAAWKGTRGS